MSGTVNIARELWDDPTFKDSEMSQREAWIWMIAEASWKDRTKRFGSQEIELSRGQLVASTRFMARAFMWSEPRVRRYLDMLENRRMITRVTDAGITVVTICNYDAYQGEIRVADAAPTQQPTHYRRTTDANENPRNQYGGGGGRARAREAAPPQSAPTFRERILAAMRLGPDGIAGVSQFVGGQGDMAEAARWLNLPGMTEDIIVDEISRLVAAKRDGPPKSFRYFTPAMTRLSGQIIAPPLSPDQIAGDADDFGNHRPPQRPASSGGQRRIDPAIADIARIVGLDQA